MVYYRALSQDELMHHGVLGMKWGVRRYQSYDSVPRSSGEGGKEIGKAKKSSGSKKKLVTKKNLKKATKVAGKVATTAVEVFLTYQMLSLAVPLAKNMMREGRKITKSMFNEPINIYDGKSLSNLTYKDLEKLDLW